jgi:hypothetical protein
MSLLNARRSRDPSLLLSDPRVYGCRLAMGDVFTSALRRNVHGATRHGTEKTSLRLLLRNRRVYRGAAYELPEKIRYNMYQGTRLHILEDNLLMTLFLQQRATFLQIFHVRIRLRPQK